MLKIFKKLFLSLIFSSLVFCLVACYVDVTGIDVTGETVMYVGETQTLEIVFTPNNADKDLIAWETSNEAIATVEKGLVKALTPGKVVISAKSKNDTKGSIVIDVYEKIDLISLAIEGPKVIELQQSELLVVKKEPNNSTILLEYSSSNPDVVSVNQEGLLVGLKEGEAVITVKGKNTSVSCSYTVKVGTKEFDVLTVLKDTYDAYKLANAQASRITLINGENTLSTYLSYKIENNMFSSLFYESVSEQTSQLSIKDGYVYMNANDSKKKYELDASENIIIARDYKVDAFLSSVNAFYTDNNFFTNLTKVSEESGVYTYELDITKYNGPIFETAEKDSITLIVTMNDDILVSVQVNVMENQVIKSTKVEYLGLQELITYPSDLNTYEE